MSEQDILFAPGRMHAGDTLISDNHSYTLSVQPDGNVVIYRHDGTPIWATGTSTAGPNIELVMQEDGNLVLYAGGTPLWSADTWDHPGAYAQLGDDGILRIHDPNPWSKPVSTADPNPVPPVVVLPRLVPHGGFFRLETGERHTVIACTDFQLFQRFLNGEDITPVLSQRRDVGFNAVRVLGMCHQMFRLYPQEHPDFFDRLPVFCSLCAQYGLYVEFVAFADATVVMPNPDDQLRHWEALGAAICA